MEGGRKRRTTLGGGTAAAALAALDDARAAPTARLAGGSGGGRELAIVKAVPVLVARDASSDDDSGGKDSGDAPLSAAPAAPAPFRAPRVRGGSGLAWGAALLPSPSAPFASRAAAALASLVAPLALGRAALRHPLLSLGVFDPSLPRALRALLAASTALGTLAMAAFW
jgi:hypothetical protein